jgi:twinkle protein
VTGQDQDRELGPAGIAAFERRGISPETAARFGIYTGSLPPYEVGKKPGPVRPDRHGTIICFPTIEAGRTVATEYQSKRDGKKRVWQAEGNQKVLWNIDVLEDPVLEQHQPLVITEGRIDALTAIECGHPWSVSVPDGAPPPRRAGTPDKPEPLDPDQEATGKFEYLWRNRDQLKRVRSFIIAVDGDEPGKRLSEELVRRLSAARCRFIAYPPDPVVDDGDGGKRPCKDLNEVLLAFGQDKVREIIRDAKPFPIKGLYRLSDYPDIGALATFSPGMGQPLDELLKLWAGEFILVTGIPNHGKSTWITNLLVNLAELHGWRSAIFSPEMAVVPQYRDKIRRIRGRAGMEHLQHDLGEIDAFIQEWFTFIDADPATGAMDEDFSLDWILDRATEAVLRYGIRVLVIDPWNEVEHTKRRDETTTEYIGRAIRAMKAWGKRYGVIMIVIAHPTKDLGKEDKGKLRMPTPYDVEGSAHWYNKPDHCIVVHRDAEDPLDITTIGIAKCRFEESGRKGKVKARFDLPSSRYEVLSA